MRLIALFLAGVAAPAALAQVSTPPSTPPTAASSGVPPVSTPQTGAPTPPGSTVSQEPEEETEQARPGADATARGGVTSPGTPIGPSVGATVYGAAGSPVGTIKAMDAQFVTLATPKGEVRLPLAGVGPGLKGPVIGLTAPQLDAAMAQAKATTKASPR